MRLFTAIELPAPLRSALADYAVTARAQLPAGSLRWVAPENLHLTLVFLGAVDPAEVEGIRRALDRVAARSPTFRLTVEGSGRFRVAAWVGVGGDTEALSAAVDDLRAELGRPDPRPFHAHVTLGRFRDDRRSRHLHLPPCGVLGRFEARHATLFCSETLPEGPRYTALVRSRFSG